MVKEQKKLSLRPARTEALPTSATSWIENRDERAAAGTTEAPPPVQPVSHAPEPAEKVKRITFDVPESLHQEVKALAARKGLSIRELMLDLLQKELQT